MKRYLFLFLLFTGVLCAQKTYNFEQIMTIAREKSPNLQKAKRSLERNKELLNAQEASLNSQFSLNIAPYDFVKQRTFSSELSRFNTLEKTESSANFLIHQPILLTDASITLRNGFSWFNQTNKFNQFNPATQDAQEIVNKSEAFTNNFSITLDQPLFTYNKTALALENVKADLDYAYLSYVLSALNLEQRVAQTFYRAYQNKLSLQVAKEDLAHTEQSHAIIKNKVDAGLSAKEELYQAELNVLSNRSAVQNAEVTLLNTLDELKQIVGLDLDEAISVITEIDQKKIDFELERAIGMALANRNELKQRQLDIRSAKASLIQAEANNEFKGNLSLSYGFTSNDEKLAEVFDKKDNTNRISMSFDIPLYDWGEQQSRENAAQISVFNAQQDKVTEELNIVIGLRKAYRSLKNQALQLDIAEQNVKIAQQTYDLNLERYRNGDLTSMDLGQFQNQLSNKKNQQIDAIISYKLQLLDLKIQALWDFEKDQPVDTKIFNTK